MKSLRVPIRIKILVAVLFAVTAVVSVITVAMANFFHEDKKTYINDLVSMTAQSTAAEYASLLTSYRQRVETCAEVMLTGNARSAERQQLLRTLFQGFPELVSVTPYKNGVELVTISDSAELDAAGIASEEADRLRRARPVPFERIDAGDVVVEHLSLAPDLPVLRLAFATPDGAVAALIRLDGLMTVAARDSVFETFLSTKEGTLLAHPDTKRVMRGARADLVPEARDLGSAGRGGLTTEFSRGDQDLLGGFAEVGFGGLIAGASIPKSAAFLASREILSKLAQVALLLLAGASAVGLFWAYRLTRPIERLSAATHDIAEGRFDLQLTVSSGDEIGDLARSFNNMARGLREREDALKTAQGQLIQSEKLAAFGQLGAGIAHEVKNPLAGILGCAQIALKRAEPGSVAHTNLQLIEKETRRCKSIIDNLLKFARQEKAALEPIGVNAVVEDAVAIVHHQLEMNHVRIETDLAPSLPEILGNSNQLQQVVMNLMINAQQAMEGTPGQITVLTRRAGSTVEIQVRDTGPGISREILEKIFEPFFTTKPSGRGTGLGLSVSFGIIKDHSGEISVESVPGRGATFVITLPVFAGASAERELVGAGAAS